MIAPDAPAANSKRPDWRGEPDQTEDDDEELAATPPDVTRMLGFDPMGAEDSPPPLAGPPGPPGAGAAGAPGSAPPAAMPSTAEIARARKHIAVITEGLTHLIDMPRGKLTKKAVFDAAATMISKGAFDTPADKQALIVELAKLPDDEPAIRKNLGALLLSIEDSRSKIHGAFGAE